MRCLIPEFSYTGQPGPSKESDLSTVNQRLVRFSSCHPLPCEDKLSPFPHPAVPLVFGAAFPHALHSSVPLSVLPACSHLQQPSRLSTVNRFIDPWVSGVKGEGKSVWEMGWWDGERRSCGERWERVESAVAHASCLEPDALCVNLCVICGLSAYCSFRGCWFLWGWMMYEKQGNASFSVTTGPSTYCRR